VDGGGDEMPFIAIDNAFEYFGFNVDEFGDGGGFFSLFMECMVGAAPRGELTFELSYLPDPAPARNRRTSNCTQTKSPFLSPRTTLLGD